MAPDDDRPTTQVCLACGGEPERRYESEGRYRVDVCRWCTGGRMTAAEVARWRERGRGR